MSDYLTVTEMALLTGLHRQTVYNKVKKAYDSGSDLVQFDKDLGYRVSKKLFKKYIVEKNTEEVEALAPAVIQLSERVYEDLLKERDALKEEVRTLYERVLNSEKLYSKYEALYGQSEGDSARPERPALEAVNEPIESPVVAPIEVEEESISPKAENAPKGLKTPSYEMSDSMFYAVLISIAVLGAVGLYIVEIL